MDGGHPVGGSRILAGLIDEHGEVLVPDLLHYYGVDLRDLFDQERPMSPRYALSLVLHLPPESAFYAARRGGQQYRGWTTDRVALVALVNAQRAANHMFLTAHSDPKKPKPKPPEPFPVPGQTSKVAPKHKPGSFAFIAAQQIRAAKERASQAALPPTATGPLGLPLVDSLG